DVAGDKKIKVAKLLGVHYVRDAIILKDFDGKAPMMDKYLYNGFKVLLNLNFNHTITAFPHDMSVYRRLLERVLNKYKPVVAVIENEPLNKHHYNDKIENYIRELQAAVNVCNRLDIKVADGGAFSAPLACVLVYKDYIRRGLGKEADKFAKRAMEDRLVRAAKGLGSSDLLDMIADAEKLVKADKSLNLDFVNIHWYETLKDDSDPKASAPEVLKEVADYFRRATGKKIITNEYGQFNKRPALTKSMIHAFRSANFRYAIMFSGTDPDGLRNTQSLNDGTSLTKIGEAFSDVLK
ncbi:MAG TPA: hypothetical protein VN958_13595, partial [Chitinophagaceae bacterium]|nr:hypothetical protein [Chitinophagaceae bacterium]